MQKKILDATCGSRSIWFDKQNPATVYCDIREEDHAEEFGGKEQQIHVHPDVVCDFTALPFPDETFSLVVFDPPHVVRATRTGWLIKKYGSLDKEWPRMLHDGFNECMRVLKPDGVLIFKWSETAIPAGAVWKAIARRPLFGHHSGKKSNTIWACFMKGVD